MRWIKGRQSDFLLLKDNWLNRTSLSSFIQIPEQLKYIKNFTVAQIIHDGGWHIPENLKNLFLVVAEKIMEVQILDNDADELVWDGSANGQITVKAAYGCYIKLVDKVYSSKNFSICMESIQRKNCNNVKAIQLGCDSISTLHRL